MLELKVYVDRLLYPVKIQNYLSLVRDLTVEQLFYSMGDIDVLSAE